MEHHVLTPQHATDRLAIRELIDSYARCADRRQADEQRALFTNGQCTIKLVEFVDSRSLAG